MLVINKIIHSLGRRIKYNLHPRAIVWKYWQMHCPRKAVITRLGKNLKVRVYPHDVIGKKIYIDGMFEPCSYNFVKTFLKKGMIVFDLGANLGQYTLLAAKSVGEQGQVHSFEPSSRMFSELSFNVSLNNLSDICTLNKMAVSNTIGTAKLSKYEPGFEVYSSLGSHIRQEATVVDYEEVKTMRLDDYIEKAGIDHVDFMKVDIEGAELMALRGAVKLLSQSDAPVILLELADVNTKGFGYMATETWDYLIGFGYHMYTVGCNKKLKLINRPPNFSIAQDVIATKTLFNNDKVEL